MRFDPVARAIALDLPGPSLSDNRSHESRVRAALESELGQPPLLPLEICRVLPGVLPSSGYKVQALVLDGPCGWETARVSAAGGSLRPYGLAVDLGSTTVVFYLVDLGSGEVISTLSKSNPQRVHGEDILERILFAGQDNGLETLQSEVIGLFNSSVREITAGQGMRPEDISFIAMAGNTTMCHLFLGLDPGNICREPYIPVVNRFDLIRPGEIGINVHPRAWLYCFPNIGSYFGGDLLAGILASGMHLREEISMLVDVGTNAEVVLGNRDWLVACAGAAGPALEGGILSCGMSARPGAIDRVEIDRNNLDVTFHTIDGKAPEGLCGSGIIDLLAAMFVAGLVDPTGKLVADRDRGRMQQVNGEWAYIVAGPHETGHGELVHALDQGHVPAGALQAPGHQGHQGRSVHARLGQTGQGIGQARTRRQHAGRELTSGPGVGVGHEGGAVLVGHQDDLNGTLGKGGEEVAVLDGGDAEHPGDARLAQTGHHGFGSTHVAPGAFVSVSRARHAGNIAELRLPDKAKA